MHTRLAATLLLLSTAATAAEVRRALLVGIDDYNSGDRSSYRISDQTRVRLKAIRGTPSRQTLGNLEGAVNDAAAMKELLIQRFGFDERNVILLTDREATADKILGLLQKHLIDSAQPGDVSLFYFAGHGSRIRNTAPQNDNAGGFDSTIIPADALLGVPDIRSKELARIYAQAAQKQIRLTVIQDSCFSGAASRGSAARNRVRAQPADAAVSVNETLRGPLPEDSGVLVLTASQDYEPAAELPSTDLNAPHGAFTWALLHVLGASPTDDRIDRIFQRVRALMQTRAPGQEPVLLAKAGLNGRGLLEQPALSDQHVTVAAARASASQVKLNGGLAMNLNEGCELTRVTPAGPPVRLRVTKVNGLASSDATIVEGSNVKPGDLFELDKWIMPDRESLRVFAGTPAPQDQVNRAIEAAIELRRRAILVDDPSEHPPTHIVQWSKSQWTLRENVASAKPVIFDAISADRILRRVPVGARISVLIPPTQSLVESLSLGPSVASVDSPDRADYVLLGRACASQETNCSEYAWALPDVTADDLGQHPSARPLRSDWFPSNQETASSLSEAALALARVAGWLDLSNAATESAWPYQLALEHADTHQLLDTAKVHGGEDYKLVLHADSGLLRDPASVPPRRVYVFAIDSWGHAKLVFGGENLQNVFPRIGATSTPVAESIPLTTETSDFTIDKPYGVDHYFLLTTATPLDNAGSVLNFDGARTRGEPSPTDPLARLLRNTATGTRGEVTRVPVNWSISRLTVESLPPGQW